MKKEWSVYLESLDMSGPIIKRAQKVLDVCGQVCPDPIEELFVSDYLDDDGTRHYTSLWLFSEEFLLEARSFVNEDDYDIVTLRKSVSYAHIKGEGYDFRKGTKKSRLNLAFSLLWNTGAEMRASQNNCQHLWRIFLARIKDNLLEPPRDPAARRTERSTRAAK